MESMENTGNTATLTEEDLMYINASYDFATQCSKKGISPTKNAIAELVSRFKKGDKHSGDLLYLYHEYFIGSIFRKDFPTYIAHKEDLLQAGALGFSRALLSYDPAFNTNLTTYATLPVRNAMALFLSREGNYRVADRALLYRVKSIMEDLKVKNRREPSISEIWLVLQKSDPTVPYRKVGNLVQKLKVQIIPASEAALVADHSDDASPEKMAIRNEIAELLHRTMVENLSDDEIAVLNAFTYTNVTNEAELADRLGIPKQHIARLYNQAILKLRTHPAIQHLEKDTSFAKASLSSLTRDNIGVIPKQIAESQMAELAKELELIEGAEAVLDDSCDAFEDDDNIEEISL